MFRNGLLLSTAMTAVALLLSGAPTGAYAQTDMHVADRDANARFLCNYGQFRVSFFSESIQSTVTQFSWEDVAVPIIGQGQTVTRIKVMEALVSRSPSWQLPLVFFAGIYRSDTKGFPGTLIAGRTHKAYQDSCAPVTITIPPTTLTANTKYWLKERTTHRHYLTSGASWVDFYWYADPKAKAKAYVRTGKGGCSERSCITRKSPWTKQTMGPWFRLK